MRRLARHALDTLTALSLLLCLATVALWVRSYYVPEYIRYCATDGSHTWRQRGPWTEYLGLSAGGAFGLRISRGVGSVTNGYGEPWIHSHNATIAGGLWSHLMPRVYSFQEADTRRSTHNRTLTVAGHYGLVALVVSGLPIARVRRSVVRRRSSQRAGLCPECGTAKGAGRA